MNTKGSTLTILLPEMVIVEASGQGSYIQFPGHDRKFFVNLSVEDVCQKWNEGKLKHTSIRL